MPGPADPHPNPVLAWSRFAARQVAARAALGEEIDRAADGTWSAAAMREFLAAHDTADDARLAAALRELRVRVWLRVAARDLAGLAPLAQVVGTMSDLAEVALAAAHHHHRSRLEAEHGAPGGGAELLVVGMGKLGGRELNVSSDVDLVFAYPEEGETAGPRPLSHQEFFVRLGQRIIRTLADATTEGFVFRVDMRLRPWGESGSLASGFDALEQYFVAHGREWERYAWIKARVVAGGDPRFADDLERIVRPFVYRKYLDYGSIDAVRHLHAQIRAEVARRELADDVKLGPGGIREIEFIAQAFQLIRGGRDADLRQRPTLAVLATLAAKRLLSAAAAEELGAAYVFLRRLEHRLQYIEDQQTHKLPSSDADRAIVARSMGYADWPAFTAALAGERATVTRHFESVFAAAGEPNPAAPVWLGTLEDDAALGDLAAKGYVAARETLARLRALRSGSRYLQLPTASRDRVDQLVPRLIDACARAGAREGRAGPDIALGRCLDFVEAISRRAAYLALLVESPDALAKVAEILASSSWAAEYLTRHPILLDELLDARVLAEPPDWSGFATQLRREMAAHEGDLERQMDLMREIHHALVFRLLTQDLAGLLTVERLADHLSLAADLVLQVTRRGLLAAGTQPPRGNAAVRGHRLRQARREGARLRLRRRHRVPVRRSARRRGRALLAARAAGQLVAREPHQRGRAVRDRPRAAAERRLGAARIVGIGVPAVSARVGVDVGAPGAHARPVLRRRRSDRRGVRGVPARRTPSRARAGEARRGRAGDAPAHARRASQPVGPVRSQARPRRHGRHRVRRAAPGARALA